MTLNASVGTQLSFNTTYCPQTNGQTERVNQVVEDLLCMYCMDHQYEQEEYLPLVEFAYNNSYYTSLRMAPFEAQYGCKHRTPISWDRVEDQIVIGPETLREMEELIL